MLDEFRSTSITWDKATSRIYSPVTANASDENGRKLVVQIVNSGQVEDLTGATLHLYWETRDKAHDGLDVFKAVDLKKGEFELSYTTGMLSNKGVLNANLVLIDTVGRVVSERFKITVTEGFDNDAIQSENSFSSLTQALIDISNLEQNYAPRLNDLTAQLQQTEQELSSQLAQKATKEEVFLKDNGININDFDDSTRQTFLEAQGIDVNYILGEKNVKPENTTFLTKTVNENLFDGIYIKDRAITDALVDYPNGRVAIVQIEPSKTYTVTKHSESDRFRIGLMESYPTLNPGSYPLDIIDTTSDDLTTFTFSSDVNTNYVVVYVSGSGQEPLLKVEEGGESTDYEDRYALSESIEVPTPPVTIESADFITQMNNNLFNGNYLNGVGLYTNPYQVLHIGSLANGKTAIIEIKPNTMYTVRKFDTSSRFRIALFNSYPDWSGGDVNIDTSINRDDTLSTFTFLSTDKSKYVVITVSNASEEPRLKLEEGSKSTPLKTYKFTDNILIDSQPNSGSIKRYMLEDANKIKVLDHTNVEETKRYYLLDTFKDLYSAPDTLENVLETTYNNIYASYDDLVTNFPDYVSMGVLGVDAWNNEIREYRFTPPEITDRWDNVLYPSNKLKLAITTGVHGNERTSIISALRFFRDLCYNPRNNNELEVLKWNVDFSIIPVACPTSFNAVSRFNSNSVNINRNFNAEWVLNSAEGSGSSAASEMETQIVQNWMKSLGDAFYFIDYHVIEGDRPMGYVFDSASATVFNGLFRGLTRKWKFEYPNSTDTYKFYGYITNPIPNGDSTRYARNLGIRGVTLETPAIYPFSTSQNDLITQRSAMEFFGNYIITLIKKS